jgi:hypothetical protein
MDDSLWCEDSTSLPRQRGEVNEMQTVMMLSRNGKDIESRFLSRRAPFGMTLHAGDSRHIGGAKNSGWKPPLQGAVLHANKITHPVNSRASRGHILGQLLRVERAANPVEHHFEVADRLHVVCKVRVGAGSKKVCDVVERNLFQNYVHQGEHSLSASIPCFESKALVCVLKTNTPWRSRPS